MSISWSVYFVNETAEEELLSLGDDLIAKFMYISKLLKEFGPHNVGMPHVRPLEDKMWEMRMSGKDNIGRSIYFLSSKQRIVVLHSFIKKTQQTPNKAMRIAKKRLKEMEND